ncbi:MAG TPA: XRE family transcriptional regulator [Candidatus Tectomicrobia bacterium]|jgi:Zn-dependent peptidase ImmA (M78 family)/DNA-binding XRE family transcriptional regulator
MESNILDHIDVRQIGKELQAARKRRGMTQEAAAAVLGVARTTITAIEKGERRLKAGELIKLARAYGRQVSDFVRQRPAFESFQPQFRGPYLPTAMDEQTIASSIETLEELCRDYLALEEIMKAPLTRKYPPIYEVAGLPPEQAAESVAIEERNRLGLGDGPISLLRDLLEQDVGFRLFYLPLPPKFSEIYVYNDAVGACMAINSQHPEERRRWSTAHGYAHFLAHRYKAEVAADNGYRRQPESERFADAFARYFLMPTGGLTRRFNDIRRTQGKVTPADLCTLAHYYGVSVEALSRHLEDLKLLSTGTWDTLRNGGFKVREAQRQLGLADLPAPDDTLPRRYQYLALTACEQELITEGQLAHFLRVDRLEARRAIAVLRASTHGVGDVDTAVPAPGA